MSISNSIFGKSLSSGVKSWNKLNFQQLPWVQEKEIILYAFLVITAMDFSYFAARSYLLPFSTPTSKPFLLRFSSPRAHIKASGDRSEHPASGELLFNFLHSFQQLLPAPSSYSGPLLTSCLVESAEVLWGAASLCHLPFTSTIL